MSEEESVHEDDMHNDAIDVDVLDEEVEEWNSNRVEEIQHQEQQVEPEDENEALARYYESEVRRITFFQSC